MSPFIPIDPDPGPVPGEVPPCRSDLPAEPPQLEIEESHEPPPQTALTRRATELSIELLAKDPRTRDIFAVLKTVLPAYAAAQGVDANDVRIGDMLQAVHDAWGAALSRAWHEEQEATAEVAVHL
jgi:hypothetical protein